MEQQKKRKKEQLSGSDSDTSHRGQPSTSKGPLAVTTSKHAAQQLQHQQQQQSNRGPSSGRALVHPAPPVLTHNTSAQQRQHVHVVQNHHTTASRESLFQEKVDASARAIKKGDYPMAIRMYTEALDINQNNHILYSNRSTAYIRVKQYDLALADARKAKELKPKWPKAYIREAAALQCLGQEAESLAAFAQGLEQDPKNLQLLEALVKAAAQSHIKEKFCLIFTQLQAMHLEESPFVVISVIGQELQCAGCYAASLGVLESALRIGTCSLRLRGSVFSAMSTAHWALGNIDKAIVCMQQDLAVAKSLGDQEGACRAHGNLGAAYFSKGSYKEALQHRHSQLTLTMRLKDPKLAAEVLSHLGHVYTAMGDYPQALTSHQESVKLVKQSHKDKLLESREIGNMGAVFLAMGESHKALECHNEHLKVAKQLGNKVEEARAYSDLGSAHHYKRDFDKAVEYHKQVLNISLEVCDRTLEARAYAGLGHAARCLQDWGLAKTYHEKQLDNALQTKDKVAEGRSCSNLGIIFQQLSEYDAALKLHKQHLQIAKDLGDRASQGRAYGNIGNAYSALGQYEVAVRFHKQELAISREVGDKNSESSTHGNLAVAYQSLKIQDKALHHYQMHLQMSRELKDSQSEARALSNLGNFHTSQKQLPDAVPYYEQYLSMSQELLDTEGEGKACHKLGYVHYCLGNYREAIRYYEQDLALAKDLQDKSSMCRAYCNLGLAHKALGDYPQSLECQKYFLATAQMTRNLGAKFSALGHIGDVLLKLEDVEQAVQMFHQQLQIAKQCKERKLEATAFGNLGAAHRTLKQLDKSLAYHNQELTLYQELSDIKGECKAHGHLGNVHMSLGNYISAIRCYEEMLDRGRELKDSSIEALVYGNLGIAHMNLAHFDDAIGLFEQQLALLEQFNHHQIKLDKARAFGNLGDCYEALGDYEEAVKCYEQYLAIAQNTNSPGDQDKAYRGLGNGHKALGNLQQALVCFEKRLVVTHEMDRPEAKSSAYGELGCLHSLLGNFEQAVSCLQNQLRVAREMGDQLAEGEAVCGLGGVYQQMGEYDRALQYHQADLDLATENGNISCQCRAYGNLGLSHESLGNFEEAIHFQEQHLSIAVQMADNIAKTLAYSSLGRVHHAMGNYPEAIRYLKEGLVLAEQFNRREDEAKIRHRLGLALWGHGDLEESQRQLYKATDLFESIRREAQCNNDYKLSMFDLQTASYQVLQRVLVSLGRHEEALVVAERGRTRAFVDFLLERQKVDSESWYQSLDSTPVAKEQILETVAKQQASVLYYSLAAGYLYCWLITPENGIVKFHESSISELETGSDPEDTQSLKSFKSLNMSVSGSVLDGFIGQVRETLGVESHISSSRPSLNRSSLVMSETESEADDIWQQHLEELGEKLNAENDRTGFLRMVNRNHLWNASSYSMNSLFSTATGAAGPSSLNGLRAGSSRSKSSVSLSGISLSMATKDVSGRPPMSALYDLLVAPMEDALKPVSDNRRDVRDLVLVLQGDLYLIPFALLKSTQSNPALYERFHLIAVPSIRAMQTSLTLSRKNRYTPDSTSCLAVGNPKLPQSVIENWQWGPLPGAEQECRQVADLLGSHPLTGTAATKDSVLQQIQNCEVLHFATHVSWKLAALVLASHGDFSTTSSVGGNLERMDLNDSNSDMDNLHGPSLPEFLLTAADILNHQLSAKLVVLSSGHSEDRAGRINSDGVVGLTRAFLAAGAHCVLFSLWPVPDLASRSFLKAFYMSLLQGAKTSQALSDAMRTVQGLRTCAHPSNWAGWVLIGSDIKLSSKVALMGHALCQLLKTPSTAREGMRVVLHLVEKSLQRLRMNQRNAMYTTVQSIENKVGEVSGWKELLTAVGFRFEAANNSLPSAVFFPTSDPGDRLIQCSASLQALLGLTVPTLSALSKMIDHEEVGEALNSLIKEVNQQYSQGDPTIQVPVSVRLWRAAGCHEFLASLGFDLVDVGRDDVTIKAGKQANRRLLQFALQALVALFDTQDAPRTILLDNSSSMESLNSNGSCTSTSNFSKGSSPPTSPTWKKKSFFNPAEMDKLPSVSSGSGKSSKSGKGLRSSQNTIVLQLNHQDAIRKKYSSPSASDTDPQEEGCSPRVLGVEEGDDNSSVCSNSGVPKPKPGTQASLISAGRGSLTRHGNRLVAHQPSKHPYSTSASDSEDAYVPENNLSKTLSQSRSSLASQGSNVTIKSNGSGGGAFRRSKARSSMASTRSSASDRTITNETEKHEEFIWDSRENFNFNPVSDNKETITTSSSSSGKSLSVDITNSSSQKAFTEVSKEGQLLDHGSGGGPRKFETAKSVDSGIDLQSSQTSQHSPSQKVVVHLEPIHAESDMTLSLSSSNTSSDVQSPPAQHPTEGTSVHAFNKLTTFQSLPVKPVLTAPKLGSFSRSGGGAFAPPTKLLPPIPQPKPSNQSKPWYQQSDSEQGELGTRDVKDVGSVKGSLSSATTLPGEIDPTVLAQKVMKETVGHKKKLDAMQKWSSENLQQRRLAREMDDLTLGPNSGVEGEGEGYSDAEGQRLLLNNVVDGKNVDSSEVDVSSTLTESSGEKEVIVSTSKSAQNFTENTRYAQPQQKQEGEHRQSAVALGQQQPQPQPSLTAVPSTIPNVLGPKLVIPEYSHIKPKNKPIVVNTLQDNSSTFTIPSTNNNTTNSNKTGPMLVAPSVPDLQDEIIERQLNRLNEGLATIPEYGVSQFSSTDTDYEPIHGLAGHHVQGQSKGALKSARARSAVRQKVVKFKDEVGGFIESPNEESMMMSPDFMQLRQQGMPRGMSRYSDDESQSDSQSEQISSLQSSLLNSSFSSREGSISGSLKGPLTGVVQQKVNSILQGIRPPSPGRVGGNTTQQPIRAQHPASQVPIHMKPQSPTGSSSGTATPPYVPSMGTPPYRLPGGTASPLSPPPPQQNYMYQGPGGQLMRPPSPASAQTVTTRMPAAGVIQTVHSQRQGQGQGMPGQMSRYGNPMGYRAPPPYSTGPKPSSPVTSTPMVPPRAKQPLPDGSSFSQQDYFSSMGGNMTGGSGGGGPQIEQQQQPHVSDFNSPANLQQASLKFYRSSENNGSVSGQHSGSATPGSPAGSVSSGGGGPGSSVRVSISSLVQNKGGGSSPGSRVGYAPYTTASSGQQPPGGRFQPMNRLPQHVGGGAAPGGGNLYHSSSLESIQSLQSFHSYPGVYNGPQSPPGCQGGTAVYGGHGLNSSQGSNREWYQSDSETSVYASGEDTTQYRMNVDRYKLPGQQYPVNQVLQGTGSGQQRIEMSHDDSWYRTTTDEEGETPQPTQWGSGTQHLPKQQVNGPPYPPTQFGQGQMGRPGVATPQGYSMTSSSVHTQGQYGQGHTVRPSVSTAQGYTTTSSSVHSQGQYAQGQTVRPGVATPQGYSMTSSSVHTQGQYGQGNTVRPSVSTAQGYSTTSSVHTQGQSSRGQTVRPAMATSQGYTITSSVPTQGYSMTSTSVHTQGQMVRHAIPFSPHGQLSHSQGQQAVVTTKEHSGPASQGKDHTALSRQEVRPSQHAMQPPVSQQMQKSSFYQPSTTTQGSASSVQNPKPDTMANTKPPPRYPGPNYNQNSATNRPPSESNGPSLANGSNSQQRGSKSQENVYSVHNSTQKPVSDTYTPLTTTSTTTATAPHDQNTSLHPPLPPRTKPPPPYPVVPPSKDGIVTSNGLSPSSETGDGDHGDDSGSNNGLEGLDNKWMSPKSQVKAEHQTRMGFLFRDMNLKASQC